ncbi:hypothetical protein DDB_G0269564 [Dictyostelium discoideum AX4]|uniref:Transmembrane protein n=1 Tax=Dictyostelium discoideum TaxID=44689 RepID=Q55DQ8_DICDI|nr:hypothetical protein DDB_G0269564 [Dictyostelium discoideum AX4]EAL72132.1 hypothetical protein DDB_G0269564 [Dictyostelium discoideum AX4]|eukprot:XP_646073.1 hypothetical protein DDB_G0269564 [Dictyostelium discoideum AX4]
MKLNYLLLSFCLILVLKQINYSVGQTINFIPLSQDASDYCTDVNQMDGNGIAYSIKTGYCFTLDGYNSHMITADKDNTTFTHYTYGVGKGGIAQCDKPISTLEFEESYCVYSFVFNSLYSAYTSSMKINITFSDGMAPWYDIPNNYYVTALSEYCNNQDILLLEYTASGTSVDLGNSQELNLFCNKQIPFTQLCENSIHSSAGCKDPVDTQTTCSKQPQKNQFKSIYCSGGDI